MRVTPEPAPAAGRSAGAGFLFLLLVAAATLALAAASASAANGPFGVALPEASPPPPDGALRGFFLWIAGKQSEFYRALVEAIQQMKLNGDAGWFLIGLSFLYGLFHAAGPGHGKVVVTSYVLASNRTAVAGVLVSLAASLAQAVSAVALIGVAAIVLNMTSIAITETARVFELGSYGLIVLLGVYLVWTKVVSPLLPALRRTGTPTLADDGNAADGRSDAHRHHHDDTGHGACCHGPDADRAASIAASSTPWRDGLATIAAVGMRPCSGALIVLVFALSQGLFWAGIAAAFAMALGTTMVVAGLVLFSVFARGLALRFTTPGSTAAVRVHRLVEGAAAVFILAVGLTLVSAALLQPAI